VKEFEFMDGNWISKIQDLLELPRVQRDETNGAEQISQFILALI
jgi:hypothetical protein